MTLLQLTPAALSLLLLAAHFFRSGNVVFVALTLGIVALLLVRKPWALRTMQAALILGALEWIRTTAALVAERQVAGLPFARLMVILGAVAAFTAFAAAITTTFRVATFFGAYAIDDDLTEEVSIQARVRSSQRQQLGS
jgi:hypothetical protein